MPRKRKLLAELSALQSNSSIPPSDALENLNTTPDGDSSPKSSKYFATEKKKSFQLEADFFSQPCISLAKSFLGQILVRRLPDGRELWGRIVETEAYLGGEDEASHSKGGKQTQRNAAMFMKPGTLYVYQIYGIYFCVNVSSQGCHTRSYADAKHGFHYQLCQEDAEVNSMAVRFLWHGMHPRLLLQFICPHADVLKERIWGKICT